MMPLCCLVQSRVLLSSDMIFFKLTSHGVLNYLWLEDLSKIFSQLIVSIVAFLNQYFLPIFIFCLYLSIDFKIVPLFHIAYIMIH